MTHIDKVSTFNCNLSKAIIWSALWHQIFKNGLIIVKILNWLRIHIHLHWYCNRNVSSMFNCRRDALDFRGREVFTWNDRLIEFTGNVFGFSEIRTNEYNFSSSSYWSFSWVNIKQVRWSEIVENVVIISVLLVIESNFNNRLSENIRRWGNTINFCRIDNLSRNFSQIFEHTEGIISVINRFIFEREEISTLN